MGARRYQILTQHERDARDLRICAMIDRGMKYVEIETAEGITAPTVSAMVKALREIDAEAAQ